MDASDLENRFAFHPADTEKRQQAHAAVRDRCKALANFLNEKLPEGREKALAITHLEDTMMWANASLARSND